MNYRHHATICGLLILYHLITGIARTHAKDFYAIQCIVWQSTTFMLNGHYK